MKLKNILIIKKREKPVTWDIPLCKSNFPKEVR